MSSFPSVSQVAAVDGEESALLAGRQVLDLASLLKTTSQIKKQKKTNLIIFQVLGRPLGVMALLDEESKFPSSSDRFQ